MIAHEDWMQRCLELASHGSSLTFPNPMVGCVIVADGRIIGEGYHHRYGGPHAEVIAIGQVDDPELLKKGTLYVNLEPCSHQGKTPPCSDLIIASQIPRVVIGCSDPNPLVAGNGIRKLSAAGIEVITGIAEGASTFLNRQFITFHKEKRPYIILKWAETADGFIDILREKDSPAGIHWITDHKLKMLVHRWRSETGAILVGAGTILHDNPQLTTREWPGKTPLRIILDANGELDGNYRVFDGSVPTWLYTATPFESPSENLLIRPVGDPEEMPGLLMRDLYAHQVQSLTIEGGEQILNSFIRANLWDEFRIFTGRQQFGTGIKSPDIQRNITSQFRIGIDLLSVGYNRKHSWV